MRVLVVGSTPLAVEVATALLDSGCEVNFVHPSEETAAPRDEAIRVVAGDPLIVLEEAGALRSDVLVACTTSDAENLVVSIFAKRRFAIPTVVARVNEPDDEWLFDAEWGVDVALSVSGLFAEAIMRSCAAAGAAAGALAESGPQQVEPGEPDAFT
ncbi:MAG: NAD-binding protein [Actinomycetota bacterium]|nr:NAD-binding protein [Actinomycetota bacterium]